MRERNELLGVLSPLSLKIMSIVSFCRLVKCAVLAQAKFPRVRSILQPETNYHLCERVSGLNLVFITIYCNFFSNRSITVYRPSSGSLKNKLFSCSRHSCFLFAVIGC